jgi:hypothetical protein
MSPGLVAGSQASIASSTSPIVVLLGTGLMLATPTISLIVVLLTTGLLLFDARVAGEDLLLANFGVSRSQVALRACVIPAIGELLVLSTFALIVRT